MITLFNTKTIRTIAATAFVGTAFVAAPASAFDFSAMVDAASAEADAMAQAAADIVAAQADRNAAQQAANR